MEKGEADNGLDVQGDESAQPSPTPGGNGWLFYGLALLLALLGLVLAGYGVEKANNARALDQARIEVIKDVSTLRARIEGSLTANLQSVQGLVAVIQSDPDIDQARFARFAAALFTSATQLRNIGGAPDMIIRLMYPLAGNERAIGLSYVASAEQREAAERARKTGEMVVAGPVNLVQGGQGFIGRIPVFVKEKNGERRFWGVVSAVIDAEKIYQVTGLLDPALDVDIAIRGRDGKGADGEPFYGDPSLFRSDPVFTEVTLPGGSWQIAAIPKGGWPRQADDAWIVRLLIVVVSVLVLLPVLAVIWQIRKNQDQTNRLRGLFDLSPIGIALNEFSTGQFLDGNDALVKPTGYSHKQFASLSYWDLTPSHYEAEELRQLEQLRTTGRYGPYEKEYIRQDGSRYPVRLNGMLIRDRSGRELIWSIVEDITERRRAEKQLAESRQQLELILDSTAVGIWDWDIPSGITRFNPRWAEIVGHTPESLGPTTIDTWRKLTHPVDLSHSGALLKAHWNGEKPRFVCRTRLRHKRGHWVWVLDTGKVVEWLPDGKPKRMVGTHMDITEQVESEQQLARQQEMLEQMSLQARIGAWEYVVDKDKLFWTDMTRLIHEVDSDYVSTLDGVIEFYRSDEHRNAIQQALAACLQEGTAFQKELMLTTARGADLWVLASGQAERVDGRTVRLFGSFQDVDARKRSQLQLEQSARHNRVLAELTVDPVVLSGDLNAARGLLMRQMSEALRVTRASLWLFRHNRESLECVALFDAATGAITEGLTLRSADYPHYFAAMNTYAHVAVSDARQDPITSEFAEHYLIPLDIKSMLDAVISTGDQVVGLVCAEQQHTQRQWTEAEENFVISLATLIGGICSSEQRRAVQQELIRARDAAEAAARAKSEFLATMSHEIRTPMNGVLGMLNLLQKPGLDPDQQRKVTIARTSAESLLALLNDILDFSKVDAGKMDLELLDFDLRALLGEFAAGMALRAQEKGVELILDLVGIDQTLVKGDPGRIRQVFTNLVGNAIKFTQEGEVLIRAELQRHDDRLILRGTVADTGIGLPPEKIAELFQPFTQGDASTTRQYGGTGLGLAISKKICSLMHGEISATSELGKGSTFTFTVQLQPSQRARMVAPSIDPRQLDILIVDNNHTNREVLRNQLIQWGATAVEAPSGMAALACCEARLQAMPERRGKPFDIAILDMMMPRMDGAELGRRLKGDPRFAAMPLVMMTSMGHRGDGQYFAEQGFSAYFPKPMTTADLFTALDVVAAGGSVLESASPLVTRHFVKSLLPAGSEAPPVWPANTRLLLVEDNAVNQEVARLMLADLGLTADMAGDGREALDALNRADQTDAYNLILMDCQMPELDGFETTRRIRAGEAGSHYQNVVVVAMTANAMKGDREKCLAAGMNDYLSKPVAADQLCNKLRHWLLGEIDETASELPAESADTTDASADQWDEVSALKMVKGKRDRLAILLRLFCDSVPERLEKLQVALSANDMEQVEYVAHSIKGSVGQLKASALHQLAARLEAAARHQNNPLVQQLGNQLLKGTPKLVARLQQYPGLSTAS